MNDARLTLLIGSRNYSSWSLRAWLAMRVSGLAFEVEHFDFYGPQRARIAQASPSGMVPCLRIEPPVGAPVFVWDSLAICEFVAEAAPQADLWPSDSLERAHARSIVAEMHSGFAELRRVCPMDMVRRHERHELTPEAVRQIKRIVHLWNECRTRASSKGDFLFGPFGIADCFYAPVVSRFHAYHVDLEGQAADYAQAVREWAAMQEWTRGAGAEEAARAKD
jgi:glutathione S-transferase